MLYHYAACKKSLECPFGLGALDKIKTPKCNFALSELRCWALGVKITRGDWYPPIWCCTEKRYQLPGNVLVCSLLQTGIAGIFGPQSDVTSMHVQSICDAIDIPHVETRWDFQLQRADMSINLFPRPSVLSQAYVDLVKIWGWRSFSLVYDEHEGGRVSVEEDEPARYPRSVITDQNIAKIRDMSGF
ncbi:glutamate receptor, ionotropic kainate 3 [Trichonephila clavipes]|nr:glutamate receptor, ionotropic kainate 3 [Trichonephila clavipes]